MQSLKNLISFHLRTAEGKDGSVVDFLIHKDTWSIDHAMVRVGGILSVTRLVIPVTDLEISEAEREFVTPMSLSALDKLSPDGLMTRFEEGLALQNDPTTPDTAETVIDEPKSPWLSFGRVLGSKVTTRDGEFGVVDDVLVNLSSWQAQYVVARSYDWKRKPSVLVPTAWVKDVSWTGEMVDVAASMAMLERHNPSYKPSSHA